MLVLITPDRAGQYPGTLMDMHRMRHRVFRERLDWDVTTSGGLEIDEYDAMGPSYLLYKAKDGQVVGGVRFLPTTGPNMLRDTFPALLGGHVAPASSRVWESSRFALDLPPYAEKVDCGVARATIELFCGVVEFGLAHGCTNIVTVTDARLERILRRVGWPLQRFAPPQEVGNTRAVAGLLEVSMGQLLTLRAHAGITEPLLWFPPPLWEAA